jgi:hypothetical protein
MRLETTMVDVPIYTQDGSQIGKLKEVHGRFFKVDAPFQPDYWLSEDHVVSATGSEIRLSFTEDRLSDYKLGDPEDYHGSGTEDFAAGNEGAGTGAGIPFDSSRETGGFTADRDVGSHALSDTETYGQESDVQPMPEPGMSWTTVMAEYRSGWQSRYGASGGRWEDFEPAYRFGYEMSYDPRYQGRDWSDVEPELRQNYGAWSQRYGYQYDDTEWDRMSEHIRDAYSHGRMRRAA